MNVEGGPGFEHWVVSGLEMCDLVRGPLTVACKMPPYM